MSDILELEIDEVVDKANNCKGIFFRGVVSSYISGNTIINQNKSLRLLKRRSCSGCEKCGWFWESINDFLFSDHLLLSNIEHNKIYTPSAIIIENWEDGVEELDGIDFINVD